MATPGVAHASALTPASPSKPRRLGVEIFVIFTGDVPVRAPLWALVACCMGLLRAIGQSRAVVGSFRSARIPDIRVIMDGQTLKSRKRGPAPTGVGTPVLVRLQPDDLELLDLWIGSNGDMSRPEAMRRILKLVAMRVPTSRRRAP